MIGPAPARGFDLARRRRQVEQRLRECDARGAVERRVVDLRVEREPAILQAFDHVETPQRPATVERLRMQARNRGFELGQ